MQNSKIDNNPTLIEGKDAIPHPGTVKAVAYAWPPTFNGPNPPVQQDVNSNPDNLNFQQLDELRLNFTPMELPEGFQDPGFIVGGPSSMFSPMVHTPTKSHPQYALSPLSLGGFLYGNAPKTQPDGMPFQFLPPGQQHDSTSLSSNAANLKVKQEASRKEKIEKYRAKRVKRNFNRPPDPARRERAQARTRILGQFAPEHHEEFDEVLEQLKLSKEKYFLMQGKIEEMNKELNRLRETANKASESEIEMKKQLAEQQKLNQDLMAENHMLWGTVPFKELFTTLNPDHRFVNSTPYKQKVNLSEVELTTTDSFWIETAREEDEQYQKRFEDMSFLSPESLS